ncbi:hypothetical protein ABK040_003353 [Willaertia magna]
MSHLNAFDFVIMFGLFTVTFILIVSGIFKDSEKQLGDICGYFSFEKKVHEENNRRYSLYRMELEESDSLSSCSSTS